MEAEVVRLLEKVGLPGPVRDRYPGELSGGELQRVTIARAVAVKPDLLICDEPTSALDPAVQTEIADLLHETAAETGAAMLLITHDLALASRLAGGWRSSTKAACWSCCRRAELGRASHPYTRALLEAMFTLTGGGAAPPKGGGNRAGNSGLPLPGALPRWQRPPAGKKSPSFCRWGRDTCPPAGKVSESIRRGKAVPADFCVPAISRAPADS